MNRFESTLAGHGLTLRRARLGNTGGNGSSGLLFAPTGPAALNVSDTVFYNETSGHGLLIQPTGAGSARAQIRTSYSGISGGASTI